MKRNIFFINILLVFILAIFISCEMEQTGTLVINLPGGGAERAAVGDDLINKLELSYNILIKGSSEIPLISIAAGTPVAQEVPVGKYKINITVLDAVGEVIGKGEQTKNVTPGRNQVTFNIEIDLPVFLTINGISSQGDNYTVLIYESDYPITSNDLPLGTSAIAEGKVRKKNRGDDIRHFELINKVNGEVWTGTGKFTVILDSGSGVSNRYRRAVGVDFIYGIAKIVDTDGVAPGDLIYFNP